MLLARGDESGRTPRERDAESVCSSQEGMNRRGKPTTPGTESLLLARGDESHPEEVFVSVSVFAPRKRG